MMSEQIITRNAVITSTSLGPEDHGIFSAYIQLDYSGSGQAFGGYALDRFNRINKEREGTAYGLEFIRRAMQVAGVARWEDLPGKYVRVKATSSKVHAIGNITANIWFCPETDMGDFTKDFL